MRPRLPPCRSPVRGVAWPAWLVRRGRSVSGEQGSISTSRGGQRIFVVVVVGRPSPLLGG